MKTRWTALMLIVFFVLLNGSMYILVTGRLANNYGNASSAKMVDVRKYLPHEAESKLARISGSLKFEIAKDGLTGEFRQQGLRVIRAKTMDDLPVMDGAAALVPVYAAFVDCLYPAGAVTYEGGSFSDDNYYGENFAADSRMQYKNTVRGYRAIVDGVTDLFFSAKPSEEQAEYAREQGVELNYVPIGREAFVFFVNEKNPVENLTISQIREIYSGKIKNWKDVGGPNRVINPVTRLEGSGSQTAMNAFMGETAFGKKSCFAFLGGSLGYSFRYYLNDMVANSGVKMLALNGVYPDEEHIRDGSYPVVAEFYAIYRADNENPYLREILDWIVSGEGQEIIEKTGYVGLK